MPSDRASLAAQLEDALAFCRRMPIVHKRLVLGHGLRVTLYVDKHGDAHVLLSRDGAKGPSDQEAATVLAKWPEPVPPGVAWMRGQTGRVAWMAAALTKPRQLKLGEGGA